MRGDGRIYKRGSRYWISYYVHQDGRSVEQREPAGKTETEALRKLKAIRKAIHRDEYLAPEGRKVTVDSLLDDLETYLRNKGAKSVEKVVSHVQAARQFFGSMRAADVTTKDVEDYTARRLTGKDKSGDLILGEGGKPERPKKPATVNRELEALRQAFNRAARVTPPLVVRVPHIPLLRVENARQGFLQRADFEALSANLTDPDVRDFIAWFWWTGMRPNEIRQLTWAMFDRETWTLNLDPKAAKIGKGRVLAITGPLRSIIERRIETRRLDCSLIFHRVSKGQPGQPIRDYRLQWRAALKAATLAPGLRPYDLRRSAVRNLIRAGVHETVAMKVSGHKTRSTFDRYNISDVEDVRAAIEKTAAYVDALPSQRNVASFAGHGQNTDKAANG